MVNCGLVFPLRVPLESTTLYMQAEADENITRCFGNQGCALRDVEQFFGLRFCGDRQFVLVVVSNCTRC